MAMIKQWLKIIHSLTAEECLKFLRVLDDKYTTEWISVFVSGALHSGPFESLTRQSFAMSPNWHTHVCQFVGGPNDSEYRVFNATMGEYVTDCVLREVRARGNMVVYTMYFNTLRKTRFACSI